MADLNALIAQGAQFRQPPDPFAQYAQMQQLQQGQQANQLNQMKMAEYQRGVESQNAMRATAAPVGVNPQHWAIDPLKALELQKTSAEAANLVSTGKKTEGEVKKQLIDFENSAKRDLSLNPSPENIQAYGQDAVLRGFATPEQAAAKVQQYLSMPPAQLVSMLSKAGITAGELSTAATAEAGRKVTERGQDITAATAKAGQESVAKTALAGQGVTIRGQNLLDTREKENIAIRQIESARKTAGLGELPPKEIQKREAAFPQATSAIKGFENKSDSFVRDLVALRDHPGLSQITGALFGRTGSISKQGSAAQALYDKVLAKGGFQALQDIRDASKTGGALGNISNQEGKQLTASFAAIDRKQSEDDVKAAIDQAIGDVQGAKTRMREAYDTTYQYKSGGTPTPAATKSGATVSNW